MKRNLPFAAVLALAALPLATPALAQRAASRPGGSLPGIAAHEIQRIRSLPSRAEPFQLPVRLDGGSYLLDLEPRSVRSVDFRVLVPREEDGRLVSYPAPPVRTVQGTVEGYAGSQVVGSLVPGGISLEVDLGDGRTYMIQPESELVPTAARSARHATYRGSDVYNDEIHVCGSNDSMRPWAGLQIDQATTPGRSAVTGNLIFDIACDADFEFYTINASSVTATVNDIEDILSRVRITYENEVDISLEVTTIVVRTSEPDPYTSTNANTLLSQTRSEWNNNPDLGNNVRRDLAELFTGKEIAGSTIGIAWLGVVCDSRTSGFGYSVVQSRFTSNKTLRKCLSAHEVGHNWNASHCDGAGDCSIMCSGINGCFGCSNFGASATNQITNHKNSRTCLITEQDELAGGFLDEFPSGSLDVLKWSYNDGAAVNGNGTNEPTAPNALDLNAAGSGPHQGDDVRTHWTNFNGLSQGSISYYVQHKGVEAGEELVVYYRAQNLRWNEIDRVTSDGVDETEFVFREVSLPGDALHGDFRLSFKTEVNESNDHWYVDNVAAGHFRDITVQTDPNPEVVTASVNDNHGNSGGTAPFDRTYNDGTSVILTAPATSGGIEFMDWFLDGVPAGSGPALSLDVGPEVIIEARYRESFVLDVSSAGLANVPVTVTPLDRNGDGSGATPLSRLYFDETQVQLTVPARIGGRVLTGWTVDGVPEPGAPTTSIVVDMSQARDVVVGYSFMWRQPPVERP